MSEPKYKLTEEKCRRIHEYLEDNLSDPEKLAFYYQGWIMAGLALQVHACLDRNSPVSEPLASFDDLVRLEKVILGICQDLRI